MNSLLSIRLTRLKLTPKLQSSRSTDSCDRNPLLLKETLLISIVDLRNFILGNQNSLPRSLHLIKEINNLIVLFKGATCFHVLSHKHKTASCDCIGSKPWKINGWNLKITHMKRKENHLPNLHHYAPAVCFQGRMSCVDFPICLAKNVATLTR